MIGFLMGFCIAHVAGDRVSCVLLLGDPHSVSARCPFFLQQLKPRLRLWKKALTVEELPPPLYPEVSLSEQRQAGKTKTETGAG